MATISSVSVLPTVAELLDGITKVAGHRQVLVRLNRLLSDELTPLGELTDVLRLDPGLAARVISAANSAYFRRGIAVASVEEAVVRVGVDEVRRLLLNSIAYELTAGALRSYSLAPGDLWNRSLVCALAMDALADATRRSGDVCHTIGLMHALGLIVIDRWLTRSGQHRVVYLGEPGDPHLGERERDVVGHTNAELCGRLLESWSFPENVVTAVTHQDDLEHAGRFQRVTALLSLARWQTQAILAGRNIERMPSPPDPLVLELTSLTYEQVSEMVPVVRASFCEKKALIGAM